MTASNTLTATRGGRIDTHHHFMPDVLRRHLESNGRAQAGGASLPTWSVDAALSFMDELSIATGIMSASAPGVYFGDKAKGRRAARAVNEFAAGVVRERPERFGFFAVLTLPDVDGAIVEAKYALDTLHADGVILLANSEGAYLGHNSFEPLMSELNARKARIFVHPNELPSPAIEGIPAFAADFLLDTTRAAILLMKTGVLTRYPDLKIILAHAGGFLPYAAYRFGVLVGDEHTTDSGVALMKNFYFDTALTTSPSALPSLLAFADPNRITYGSDWCWAPVPMVKEFAARYEAFNLSAEQRQAIDRANAEKLFPRLAAIRT